MAELAKPSCTREYLEERLGISSSTEPPATPQVIDEVEAPDYQYAAAYCDTLNQDEIPRLELHKDEDSARRVVRYVSRQFQKVGLPDKSMVMRRAVHYGPWEVVTDG